MDQVDYDAPIILEQLNEFIKNSIDPKKTEALIYALAQVLHNQLEAVDMDEDKKGMTVSTLIQNFIDFNQVSLAVYNEMIRLAFESKTSTIH